MKIMFVFKSENFLVPIGICAITAVAIKNGHRVYLVETHHENPVDAYDRINPDIVAYSSSTGESKHYVQIDASIKAKFPNAYSIVGGPHATFYPEVVKESSIDAACMGEGEIAFAEFMEKFTEIKNHNIHVQNIITKYDTKIDIRDLVSELDTLPFPDYSLMYDGLEMGKYPLKGFITSRGCPYQCSYCFNTSWRELYKGHGKVVRRHSVSYVIEDILRVKSRWPLSCVKFQDDVFSFVVDDWLEDFVKQYKKHINLPFFVLNRCDLITEDMVKLLREAGCQTMSMSIEAGDASVRLNRLHRKMTDDQIVKAHRICDKYHIATFTNCIAGIPDTTTKEDVASLDLALKSGVTWAEFPVFYPFPKTELGNYAIEKGYYKPNYNSMHTSYQNASILSCFTKEEKQIQMNFGILASIAVAFPMLRNYIVKYAMYFPHNKMFTLAYWISKNFILRNYVYSTKTSWIQSIRMYLKSLHQEMFRHTTNENNERK